MRSSLLARASMSRSLIGFTLGSGDDLLHQGLVLPLPPPCLPPLPGSLPPGGRPQDPPPYTCPPHPFHALRVLGATRVPIAIQPATRPVRARAPLIDIFDNRCAKFLC